MNRLILISIFLATALIVPTLNASDVTDTQIKQMLVKESQANYPGNCPCPENRDRAGRRCGKRSAYIRAGGYSPLCYETDITPNMIQEYRSRRRGGPSPN